MWPTVEISEGGGLEGIGTDTGTDLGTGAGTGSLDTYGVDLNCGEQRLYSHGIQVAV